MNPLEPLKQHWWCTMTARKTLHTDDAEAVADIANALQIVAPLADRIRCAVLNLSGDCAQLDAKVTEAIKALQLLQPPVTGPGGLDKGLRRRWHRI